MEPVIFPLSSSNATLAALTTAVVFCVAPTASPNNLTDGAILAAIARDWASVLAESVSAA